MTPKALATLIANSEDTHPQFKRMAFLRSNLHHVQSGPSQLEIPPMVFVEIL